MHKCVWECNSTFCFHESLAAATSTRQTPGLDATATMTHLCHPAANVEELTADPGKSVKPEDIVAALQQHKPAVLFVCQGESSSGVQQSLAGAPAGTRHRNAGMPGR
jgi:hypothetical protein